MADSDPTPVTTETKSLDIGRQPLCTPNVSSIGQLSEQLGPEDFKFWYPSWGTWQLRRTLTYWIAITFGEGSILFVIGAAFAMSGLTDKASPEYRKTFELVLVNTPYCIGAVSFSIGAYCGVLEVINLPNKESDNFTFILTRPRTLLRQLRVKGVDWKCFGSYLANFIGAIAFNIDTLAGYCEIPPWPELILTWGMATVGGLGFTIGGIFDCLNTKACNFEVNTAQWWVTVGNTFGGICFLIPGVVGLFSPPPLIYYWVIDFVYLVGSISFFVASIFLLWMWKNEQYGLGRLPELNGVEVPEDRPDILDFHGEYGCGKSSASQIPWLLLYQINSSLSVVDVAIVIALHTAVDTQAAWSQAMRAALNFMLSHGILLLGSVIHHIPTKAPFSWLLMYMRFVLLLYTIHSAWSVAQEIQTLWEKPL